MIRAASEQDAAFIATIYNEYVTKSHVTFEEQSVSQQDMAQRIIAVQNAHLPWLVAQDDENHVIGYAYASPWKTRSAYRHSVEITVYLATNLQGKGLGTLLYQALFKQLQQCDIHVVIAGIALPNLASIALHEKFNMEKVGQFKQVGRKFNQWIDVGYWQGNLQSVDNE